MEQVEKWRMNMRDMLSAYVDIPQLEWEKLQSCLHVLKIEKDDFYIHSGDRPEKLAFIAEGLFRVFYTTASGVERVLVFRGEGRLLSAYSSFLEQTDSKFSFQALEDSTLLYMTLENYEKLLAGHNCWQIIGAKYAELLFIEKEKRENEFLCDDAETRYRGFLQNFPYYENRIHQYQIASYLGITPVALSRIRKKME